VHIVACPLRKIDLSPKHPHLSGHAARSASMKSKEFQPEKICLNLPFYLGAYKIKGT
jgi:hypothetical protein